VHRSDAWLHAKAFESALPPRQPAAARGLRTSLPVDSGGLVEFVIDLGAPVRRGDVVARVHHVEHTGAATVDYRAACEGILASRLSPVRFRPAILSQ